MFQRPLGPVEIDYDGTVLGHTVGGATLSYSESAQETTIDRTGTLARSRVITGVQCSVTGAIGEATLAQLAAISGGTVDSGTVSDALHFKSRVGTDLRESAKVCKLKPIEGDTVSTDETEWILLPAATILANFETPFNLESQKVYGFSIMGHPVTAEEVGAGGRLESDVYAEHDTMVFGKQADT